MTENTDCKAFKENPELFKLKLRNIIEQITSSTSEDAADVSLESQDVLEKQRQIFEATTHKVIFDFIDNMWNVMEINPKIRFLRDLEVKYPEDFVAWRPTAGKIPFRFLNGEYLTNTKQRLFFKLHKLRKDNNELKEKHSVQLNALKESFEKIDKGKEYLFNVYNEYEKIFKYK